MAVPRWLIAVACASLFAFLAALIWLQLALQFYRTYLADMVPDLHVEDHGSYWKLAAVAVLTAVAYVGHSFARKFSQCTQVVWWAACFAAFTLLSFWWRASFWITLSRR